jgi:GRIM-19 protein
MPPAGGFEAIKYKRNLPFRGPGSLVILGGVTGICVYGFYRLGKGNLERRYEPILSSVKVVIWESPERGTWLQPPRSPRNVVRRIRPHVDELICHLAFGPQLKGETKLIWFMVCQRTAAGESMVAHSLSSAAYGRG